MKRLDLLDETDRQLISLLQVNARESIAELACKLGVARTTIIARIERLEKNETITGYTVKLGQNVLSSELNAYVGITVQPKSNQAVVVELERIPEIQLLCAVSGEFDYVAWVKAINPEQLDHLLNQIGNIDGVMKTTTSIVLARKIDRSAS